MRHGFELELRLCRCGRSQCAAACFGLLPRPLEKRAQPVARLFAARPDAFVRNPVGLDNAPRDPGQLGHGRERRAPRTIAPSRERIFQTAGRPLFRRSGQACRCALTRSATMSAAARSTRRCRIRLPRSPRAALIAKLAAQRPHRDLRSRRHHRSVRDVSIRWTGIELAGYFVQNVEHLNRRFRNLTARAGHGTSRNPACGTAADRELRRQEAAGADPPSRCPKRRADLQLRSA